MMSLPLLVSRYLDADLDDQAVEELSGLLGGSAAAIDDFVVDSYIHSQLIDLMGQRRVQSDAAADTFAEYGSPDQAENQAAGAPSRSATFLQGRFGDRDAHRSARRTWLWRPAALAAAVVVAASVSVLAYVAFSRPVIVAQLSKAAGCRWRTPDGTLGVGTLLQSGQVLQLIEGRALVTFESGAQIVCEGPATLRLDSASAADLSSGRITTKVPTQAVGFTVTSPLAQFVDLGTEFTVKMDAERGFELHVYDGLVELQLLERSGKALQKPLRISELAAVGFDAQRGDVVKIPCDWDQRLTP